MNEPSTNEASMNEPAPDRSPARGRSSASAESSVAKQLSATEQPSHAERLSTSGGAALSHADGAGADTDAGAVADGRPAERPESMDGVTKFMGMRWDDPQTIRLRIRPELINAGGLLSGVATYALVDYCMGSTLWAQTTEQERIATIGISINYVQTATEGEIVCTTELDRRNRFNAVMRSEVRHEDGRLLATAIGSYAIFVPRRPHVPPV
jgi:uncharacterized protein (TIGR00369 family)